MGPQEHVHPILITEASPRPPSLGKAAPSPALPRGLHSSNCACVRQDPSAMPRPTSQDLAGYWDMLQLSVQDVSMKFDELHQLKLTDWKVVESPERKVSPCCIPTLSPPPPSLPTIPARAPSTTLPCVSQSAVNRTGSDITPKPMSAQPDWC